MLPDEIASAHGLAIREVLLYAFGSFQSSAIYIRENGPTIEPALLYLHRNGQYSIKNSDPSFGLETR